MKTIDEKNDGLRDIQVELSRPLREALDAVSSACIVCGLCQKECAFLKRYGLPKEIADRYDPARKEDQGMPFECSLCGLCTAVCPQGVDPAELFLQMRKETVRRGVGNFPEHNMLKGYERRGVSRTYSYYGLPKGCDTVFFPGCTLSGTHSDKIIVAFQKLREKISSLGIVLDCCMKPSHDLGREKRFKAMFGERRDCLLEHGIRNVLVACPNCYKVFAQYGAGLSTGMIYELLFEEDIEGKRGSPEKVTLHDPCAVRFEIGIHESIRRLLEQQGCEVEEMAHSGQRTLCCGEGGAAAALDPGLAANWTKRRQVEADGRRMITYCAGCANRLSSLTPTEHVLDVLWKGKSGRTGIATPPFTYWKRLRMKQWFKRNVPQR
jgi:Fe-S oxidoreductase